MDFPEEKSSSKPPEQEPILLPPTIATIEMLEEVNRNLTATCYALASLVRTALTQPCDKRDEMEVDGLFEHYREQSLHKQSQDLEKALAKVAGPDPAKQIAYLQRYPESILFSGAMIAKLEAERQAQRKQAGQ